ncbi:TPA: hypothetical protein U1372_002148, partial [Streptococcus suis]|nr:hypothetical protein [Streptococcus suis]
MAKRYVYFTKDNCIKKELVDFQWYSGFSKKQKQKSIEALHKIFLNKYPSSKILEVSTASSDVLGVQSSAFNLSMTLKNSQTYSVESLFHASKVFEKSGLNSVVLRMSSKEAKRHTKNLHSKEKMVGFNFFGIIFPLLPQTYFYNWLYVNAMYQNKELYQSLLRYDSFTDINFNPELSINCQAEACSIFCFLHQRGLLNDSVRNPHI